MAVRFDPAAPPVCGERHALEQVVVNLVANACQAAPGTRVTIGTLSGSSSRASTSPSPPMPRTIRPDQHAAGHRGPGGPSCRWGVRGVLLYVADDGPGVAEEHRERIFDPFFTTKDPGQGTGLGLAIVARTVHESGGVVWVDRAREGGAVFKVFLPLAGGSDASADR